MRMCAHSAVAPLVQENTRETVSRFQGAEGVAESASELPPHASSTAAPCMVIAIEAPISPRSRKLATKASNTGRKAGAQNPLMAEPLGALALTASSGVPVQMLLSAAIAEPPHAVRVAPAAAPSIIRDRNSRRLGIVASDMKVSSWWIRGDCSKRRTGALPPDGRRLSPNGTGRVKGSAQPPKVCHPGLARDLLRDPWL